MIPAPAPSPPPPGARRLAPADARLLGTLGSGRRWGGGGIPRGGPWGQEAQGAYWPRLVLTAPPPRLELWEACVAGVGVGWGRPSPRMVEEQCPPHTHTTASSGRRRPRSGCVRGAPADHSGVDRGLPQPPRSPGHRAERQREPTITCSEPTFRSCQKRECPEDACDSLEVGVIFLMWRSRRVEICNYN